MTRMSNPCCINQWVDSEGQLVSQATRDGEGNLQKILHKWSVAVAAISRNDWRRKAGPMTSPQLTPTQLTPTHPQPTGKLYVHFCIFFFKY